MAAVQRISRNANGIGPATRRPKVPTKSIGSSRILGDITNVNKNAGTKSKKENEEKKAKKTKEILKEVTVEPEGEMDISCSKIEPSDLPASQVADIDADDMFNPLLCAEYVKDIYKYMNRLERRLQVKDYFSERSEINPKMRSILIDWLIQVQSRFNLLQETLYLTVHLIDRYLEKADVSRSELQLVGVSAMLLASKYEEMYAPEIGDFVYITDNAYTKNKIQRMEQQMMKVLQFDVSNPLCLHFLRRNSKAGEVDAQKHTLAKYLMELTLVDFELATCLPSQIAAAALCLSLRLTDGSPWTPVLEHYSGYSESSLSRTLTKLAQQVVKTESNGNKYEAVKNKYAASKFMRISRLSALKGDAIQQLAGVRIS